MRAFGLVGFGAGLPISVSAPIPGIVPLLDLLTLVGQLSQPPAAPRQRRGAERPDCAGAGWRRSLPAEARRAPVAGAAGGLRRECAGAAAGRRRLALGGPPPRGASARRVLARPLPAPLRLPAPGASYRALTRCASSSAPGCPACCTARTWWRGCRALLGSPYRLRAPASRGCPSGGPFPPRPLVGSPRPGRLESLVASTSWGHLPFKSCPAFALRQAPPSCSPSSARVPALASHRTSHSFATTRAPQLTDSGSCPAVPTTPPNRCYFFGLAFDFPNSTLPLPFFLFCPRIPSFLLSFLFLFGVSHCVLVNVQR